MANFKFRVVFSFGLLTHQLYFKSKKTLEHYFSCFLYPERMTKFIVYDIDDRIICNISSSPSSLLYYVHFTDNGSLRLIKNKK